MSAAGYTPHPIPTDAVRLEADLVCLTERLAENAHELWAEERIRQGWTFGPERNDDRKEHPSLIPYSDLPEKEKDLDRKAAMGTIKAILALGGDINLSKAVALLPGQVPAGWEEHLTAALAEACPRVGRLCPLFDMRDDREVKVLRSLGAVRSAEALEFLGGPLKETWATADAAAMNRQARHRTIAALAIWPGITAILLAILQLALKPLGIVSGFSAGIAHLETAAVVVALSAVVWGLYTHLHHGWLASRQIAERLRILKFESLSWPELWCDFDTWKQRVRERVKEIQSTGTHDAHLWAKEQDDVGPVLPPAPNCSVPPADILALAIYYRIKRLKFQHEYFTRQALKASGQSWIAKYKLSLVFFLLSVGAVAAHNVMHFTHHPAADISPMVHDAAAAPNPWEIAAISLAALLPVLGFGFRAWLAAFEAVRSRNLYRAKAHAISGYLNRGLTGGTGVGQILHNIAHGEHFFTGEHREWCRLQLEAEWLA